MTAEGGNSTQALLDLAHQRLLDRCQMKLEEIAMHVKDNGTVTPNGYYAEEFGDHPTFDLRYSLEVPKDYTSSDIIDNPATKIRIQYRPFKTRDLQMEIDAAGLLQTGEATHYRTKTSVPGLTKPRAVINEWQEKDSKQRQVGLEHLLNETMPIFFSS